MLTTNQSFTNHDFSNQGFKGMHFKQCNFYRCNFNHSDLSELAGLNIRRVRLDGVTICDRQQEQLLDSLGVIVLPN